MGTESNGRSSRPLILVSNDDGLHAEGILALADAMTAVGDVWVVAPDRECSATSHALSLHKPLRFEERGSRRFAVDGTPIDAVYVALHHVLPRKPDLVVSGVNHGPNVGTDVIYSGTIAAAMEGTLGGIPSIAASLCLAEDHRLRPAHPHFATAARVAADLAADLLAHPNPTVPLFNVNTPDVPYEELRGVRPCRLTPIKWDHAVVPGTDPRGRTYLWIAGERAAPPDAPDGDVAAIAEGFASVTPLGHDLTQTAQVAHLTTRLAERF